MRVLLVVIVLGLTTGLLCAASLAARGGSESRETGNGARNDAALRDSDGKAGNRGRSGSTSATRLREGTVITDATGHFREDGDGASFVSDAGQEFGALQNLGLERVVRMLKGADEPSSIRWSVTGTVTEYSGRNYILLKRAVYKSATPPPIPDRVAAP